MQILMKQTVLLIIFLLNTITSSFAFEKKVFSQSEFIKNDDCIFLQNSIFGDFSIEREKDSYGIGKIENDDVIENHYYKEGEYYNCRAKCLLSSRNGEDKAFLYINADDIVIDVSNRFSNLEQIRFFYVNQENKIIVNCADNVRVKK